MIVRNWFFMALFGVVVFASQAQCGVIQLESHMKKTKEFRAEFDWELVSFEDEVRLTFVGDGIFNKFKNAKKEIEVIGKNNADIFRIQKSLTRLTNRDTNKFVEHKKEFDYIKNIVTYERRRSQKGVTLTKSFPIKGVICDDASMVYCVERLLAHDQSIRSFYLVTNEPKMYKVMIFDRGIEQVDDRVVRKFQLIADLGKLTNFIIKFIPPTYVWYEKELQHRWFQYEGMESGRFSANIIISPVSRLR